MPAKTKTVVDRHSRNQWYGYVPDLPDHRDYVFALGTEDAAKPIPAHFDLRDSGFFPPIYDQGPLGSCTGNAIAAAWEYEHQRQKQVNATRAWFNPSRLFIYYNEREMEGSVNEDAGAMIRDGIKSVNTLGVCGEKQYPYDIERFTKRPTKSAYHYALKHVSLKYQRVEQNLQAMKQAIAVAKLPNVVGFSVYESFESREVDKTGMVPMPGDAEALLGGHAVLVVGYQDVADGQVTEFDQGGGRFICRNSWGEDWGDNGHFTLPYAYLTDPDLAEDFWVIQQTRG